MNAEYLWWVLALLLVGGGAIAFLTLGTVPEIDDEPGHPGEPEGPDTPAPLAPDAPDQSPPVSTSVPGSDEPDAASETP